MHGGCGRGWGCAERIARAVEKGALRVPSMHACMGLSKVVPSDTAQIGHSNAERTMCDTLLISPGPRAAGRGTVRHAQHTHSTAHAEPHSHSTQHCWVRKRGRAGDAVAGLVEASREHRGYRHGHGHRHRYGYQAGCTTRRCGDGVGWKREEKCAVKLMSKPLLCTCSDSKSA